MIERGNFDHFRKKVIDLSPKYDYIADDHRKIATGRKK